MTLREDTVFSDGSPLTSADVVNAFERNGESDLYGAFLSFITAVSAPDERTVHFKLNAPMGSVLQERLALVRVFPATITDEELAKQTRRLGSVVLRDHQRRRRGPHLLHGEPPLHRPLASHLRAHGMVGAAGRYAPHRRAYRQRRHGHGGRPGRARRGAGRAGATVEWVPGFNLPFLMFNCEKPPFDDVRVRQALLYAIDVDSLIGTYMAGHARGGHVPSARLLPALPPHGHGLQLRP